MTGAEVVATGVPVQAALAQRRKVIVPLGAAPPARVALLETLPPATGAEGRETVAFALPTVIASVPQGLSAPLLLASPL